MDFAKRYVKDLCNPKRRLPILTWAPQYRLETLLCDLVAGFTVGLTIIPQGIAYAAIANLPTNYGLYAACTGGFVYMLFGTNKALAIGPTAITALMTYDYTMMGGIDYTILLTFFCGIVILIAGFCNMGFLTNFLSKPVISGFTSAAAITIASSQLKGLFGLRYKSSSIIDTWYKLAINIPDTRWEDFTLGLVCCVILIFMKKMKEFNCAKIAEGEHCCKWILKKLIFFVSCARNAIIVMIAATIAYFVGDDVFILTGEVQSGLPPLRPPPFSTIFNNRTIEFPEMASDMAVGSLFLSLIAILSNVAVATAFAEGKSVDANQEMFALGLSNIVASFVGSMPVCAGFSRSAVNYSSGVRTQAGGIITGSMVILALATLTEYFAYIPRATLSAVILSAIIFMIEYEVLLPIWRVKRIDMVPLWVTFLSCLFMGVAYGILVGAAVNMAILVYGVARPQIDIKLIELEDGSGSSYMQICPDGGLQYPTAEYLAEAVRDAGAGKKAKGRRPIVIDCTYCTKVDYTSVKVMETVFNTFKSRKQPLILMNVKPDVEKGLGALGTEIIFANNLSDITNAINEAKVKELEV